MNLVNIRFLIIKLIIITDTSFVPDTISAPFVSLVHSMIAIMNNLLCFTLGNFITVAIGTITIMLNHMVSMKHH